MSNSKLLAIGILAIIFFITGCRAAATSPLEEEPTPAAEGVIVLGDISDSPSEKIRRFQPLADYLAARLGEYGIGAGEVKIAPDIDTMSEWLANGEVDLYFDSPYPVMIASRASGARPILRRWKGEVDQYHTLFFARTDSGITSLEDLNGRIVAFEESFSTSGYMLPFAHLVMHGMEPVETASENSEVAADEVGYLFSNDDQNTIQWVISGKVPAGVVDSTTYMEIPEDTREALTVVAKTDAVPRQMVLAQPNMDPDLLEAIKTELINLDETEEGQAVLEMLASTQFDEFPEGPDAALARLQAIYRFIEER